LLPEFSDEINRDIPAKNEKLGELLDRYFGGG
jgi:hypothetical protein